MIPRQDRRSDDVDGDPCLWCCPWRLRRGTEVSTVVTVRVFGLRRHSRSVLLFQVRQHKSGTTEDSVSEYLHRLTISDSVCGYENGVPSDPFILSFPFNGGTFEQFLTERRPTENLLLDEETLTYL